MRTTIHFALFRAGQVLMEAPHGRSLPGMRAVSATAATNFGIVDGRPGALLAESKTSRPLAVSNTLWDAMRSVSDTLDAQMSV